MTEYTNGEETMQLVVVENIASTVRNDLKRLHDIWKEMGLSDETKSVYCQEVHKHIKELMSEMINELEEKKNAIVQGVQHLMQLANSLAKELQIDDIPGKSPDYEHLPLIEVQDKLKVQVQELQMIKDRRLEYLKELRAKEEVICKKLGTKPISLNKEIPSDEDLIQFHAYLEIEEREMVRLETLFNDYRRSVLKLMGELRMTPTLDFERVVCQESHNFVYTTENMTKLKEMRDDLKGQVEDAKQQADEKREELKSIWNYLDEPEHLCDSFLRKHQGYNCITIAALNAEIKRCKDKRSENIAKYVAKVREELEVLWELCKFSENQKRVFLPFHSQTYTEDLLTLHELEAEKLRKFYKTNKKIFDLLEERETLWEKMKELDQRANDPDRFHNRGGQLLAEEKERKNTNKKLPKIEGELMQAADEFEVQNGDIFTVNGVPLNDFLDFTKTQYEKEKENMKIARKQAKDKSAKKTPLSTSKRTPIAMSIRVRTPGGGVGAKRKLPYDSSPNSTVTKRRNVSGEKNRTAVISSKARRSGRISKKTINLNKTNTPWSGKKNLKSKVEGNKDLSISSYGKFQEHLEERGELRSSMLSEQLLENACGRGNMKTPVRTPAKPMRKNLLSVNTAGRTPRIPKTTSTSLSASKSPTVMNTQRLAPLANNTHFIV